jgi:hypothetical protein
MQQEVQAMTTTAMCKHGVDHYVSSCGQCDRERADFERSKVAYEAVSRDINGGNVNVLGAVLGAEHPYLLQKLAEAVAFGVLQRTYDRLCTEQVTNIGTHPEHDGRLSCGTVVGALRTLATRDNEDVLAARTFWLSRIYQPEF